MFCPNCGSETADSAAFCGQCGNQLEKPETTAQPARRKGIFALALYFLILIIIGVTAWYFFLRPEDGSTQTAGGVANPNDSGSLDEVTAETPTPTPTSTETLIPTNTATPTPSNTPSPTLTPTSTPTPSPSNTPRPTATSAPSATPDPGPEEIQIGSSYLGQPIEAVRFGSGSNVVVFVGGLHEGFTPATVRLAEMTIEYFTENPDEIPAQVTIFVIRSANPDSATGTIGFLSGRLNGNGVDLNRNWACRWQQNPTWAGAPRAGVGGSQPLSEPEAKSLSDFFNARNPTAVVVWLARVPNGLVSAGSCGSRPQVSENLAITYGSASGYLVDSYEEEFDPVSGDITNDLDSRGIPAIAVILSDYNQADWEMNLRGILAVVQAASRM